MFEKDNSYMEFKPDEYGGYVITLQETEYGNLDQSRIDEDDFFQWLAKALLAAWGRFFSNSQSPRKHHWKQRHHDDEKQGIDVIVR